MSTTDTDGVADEVVGRPDRDGGRLVDDGPSARLSLDDDVEPVFRPTLIGMVDLNDVLRANDDPDDDDGVPAAVAVGVADLSRDDVVPILARVAAPRTNLDDVLPPDVSVV